VLAFYKPVGVTCTEKDPHAEKKINDIVKYPERVTYAGRLDKESEGLLLLSNDGELINAMMRGANRHEKEYTVKTDKEITAEFIDKMSAGIYLKDLDTTTRECNVTKLGKFTFNIILTQGLNRQIRRMCEACGYRIKSLKRTRVMNITLGQLKPGQYRQLGAEELNRLYAECGLKPTTAR
jgi:23S rRNA pseudouridine2604 synthase